MGYKAAVVAMTAPAWAAVDVGPVGADGNATVTIVINDECDPAGYESLFEHVRRHVAEGRARWACGPHGCEKHLT